MWGTFVKRVGTIVERAAQESGSCSADKICTSEWLFFVLGAEVEALALGCGLPIFGLSPGTAALAGMPFNATAPAVNVRAAPPGAI